MIFVALFLVSCSMVFLQLGFTNVGRGAGDTHYMFSLIPVVVTAFLLGPSWGMLQGALTGIALNVHSMLQPLDWMEYAFLNPLTAVVPLALAGLGFGLAFSRLERSERLEWRSLLWIALTCAVGTLLFELAFNLALQLSVLELSMNALASFATKPLLNTPFALVCESLALLVSVLLADGLQRHVMTPGEGARLHIVFGSRLFGLLLVVFAVTSAMGYALITHLDISKTSAEMNEQLEAIAAKLEEQQDWKERNETANTIFQAIIGAKDGDLVLIDGEGTVVASNNVAYVVGSTLTDRDGQPLLPEIAQLASDGTMKLAYARDIDQARDRDETRTAPLDHTDSLDYARAKQVGNYYLLQIRSHATVFSDRNAAMLVSILIAGSALVLAFVFASRLLHSMVEQPIDDANESLAKITDGDLDHRVRLRSSKELASLGTYINAAVASLKNFAAESQRRIEQDLYTAKDIQESALPRTFPPIPGVDAFDVYASMHAAKYVGGDFYDLFRVGDHELGFLIADVSGKGIPAALFMMKAKTHIATAMRSGVDLVQAVSQTNDHLCEDNDTCMFVTMWAAILDWVTGELTYVNAGHDIPLLRHNGQWQWFEDVGGPLLGAMDSMSYDCATVTLDHGDALYLYTDGVTEAMNPEDQIYGKDRMLAFLQQHADLRPRELDDAMRAELASWANGAEQSDDITMLTLEYKV